MHTVSFVTINISVVQSSVTISNSPSVLAGLGMGIVSRKQQCQINQTN